jgi:hypothetical protein
MQAGPKQMKSATIVPPAQDATLPLITARLIENLPLSGADKPWRGLDFPPLLCKIGKRLTMEPFK